MMRDHLQACGYCEQAAAARRRWRLARPAIRRARSIQHGEARVPDVDRAQGLDLCDMTREIKEIVRPNGRAEGIFVAPFE